MQWSQIKTLFILCFLVLDVYLLFQFFDKQSQSNIGVLERQDSPIEEQLESEDIKINSLPEKVSDESFLSVKPKSFSTDDLKKVEGFKNQEPLSVDKNFIISEFEDPVPISPGDSEEKIEETVKKSIIYPKEYTFWDWNKDLNVLFFFQEKKERPIYFNQNGMVLVFLNDDNEMIYYTQTMLGDAEPRAEKKTLIKPIKAIETLYKANTLNAGDEITKVNIGFHTRVPLANGVQVFVPTWKVTVNEEKNYFVNAIEGFVFSSDENSFISDVLTEYVKGIRQLKGDQKVKGSILNQLEKKLEIIHRGEEDDVSV
ncbi:two-component system regulatory protein YycI [Virgibacillus alimentarius]|uniref:Regulatory protein YycI of two-component signal transduction system YycFG n=1 Tax=Virgibacillus alimentarius TaxID=698769 RepID=A0ABS4S7J9_9BACI|nr:MULTISPECIES: two-component system regulatory protein YycI [Virgibacillus]MBP2257466.1 regulatory protein YycI of two-component signal transduction system YycFG [Virgibacillus alimentarius]HLR68751.1 two-component system regulatory protein YycI [Virgibacillus sp.]